MSLPMTAGDPARPQRGDDPQFAVTMRGYDRLQVGDYVDTLRGYLDEAQLRALDAEEEVTALRAREATRLANRDQTTDELTAAQTAPDAAPRMASDEVVQAISATLQAAEQAAQAIRAEAEVDRANARALIEAAEQEARQRAGEIIDDAQRNVDRLARHAELERTRRDTVRRQLAALRTALDEVGLPGTGEIDLTAAAVAAAAAHAEQPAAHVVPLGIVAEADADTVAAETPVDPERTTLLRIPR